MSLRFQQKWHYFFSDYVVMTAQIRHVLGLITKWQIA